MRTEWTDEENRIIRENHGKLTLYQIIPLLPYKRTYGSLKCHCRKTLKLTRNKSIIKLPTKYFHNTEYWSKPTIMNSYLCGILSSDGNLALHKHGGYTFQYKIHQQDEFLTDLFIKELKFTGRKFYTINDSLTVKYGYKKSPMVTIRINCFNKCAQDLKLYYNIIPNKTKVIRPTNLLDEDCNFAYILGYLTGDGAIMVKDIIEKNGNKRQILFVTVTSSSKDVVYWIKELIDRKIGYFRTKLANVNFYNNCYVYSVTGLRGAILIDYLRQFPVPKLIRKFETDKLLEYIGSQKQKHPELFLKHPIFSQIQPTKEITSQTPNSAVITTEEEKLN